RDVTKSAAPRGAAPVADAFLQIDLRAWRDALHNARPAARRGAHRNRRSRHRQFRERRSDGGHGNRKPKAETRDSPHIFVARHVGPFGPKAGSMRKLSAGVIAPSGKASSGMTRVA